MKKFDKNFFKVFFIIFLGHLKIHIGSFFKNLYTYFGMCPIWRWENFEKSSPFFLHFFLFIKSPILNNILSYTFPDKHHLKIF